MSQKNTVDLRTVSHMSGGSPLALPKSVDAKLSRLLVFSIASLVSTPAMSNDRIPVRLQKAFSAASAEAKRYARYILDKVWGGKIAVAKLLAYDPTRQRARVDALVDEAAHLILPFGKRIVDDVVFGTKSTHLRVTMPDRGKLVPKTARGQAAIADLTFQMTDVAERELNDRLESALVEELEDFVQRGVEGDVGLPVRGRPRGHARPLPRAWEQQYANVRNDVYEHVYWWLRKRRRLELEHLATSKTHDQIDQARDKGDIWGLISAASHEAWAMNRLSMDFKWGRFGWETQRRQIRRRMDQDLARGTWGLARLVKEIRSDETRREVDRFLDRRLQQEMSRGNVQKLAERYPDTADELRKTLGKVKDEAGPIFDRAMDRVELPDDMRELARAHGRRYGREEMDHAFDRSLARETASRAAARRVREKLKGWIDDALTRIDLGGLEANRHEALRRAQEAVKGEVEPKVDQELDDALREASLEEAEPDGADFEKTKRNVRERLGLDRDLQEGIKRRLHQECDDSREGGRASWCRHGW